MDFQLMGDIIMQVTTPQPSAPGSADWQKNIDWALSLPIGIAGAIASIYLLPKLRLQNRKTALEIETLERDLQLAQARDDPAEAARIVAGPIVDSRRAQDLILRFVFLYLLLQAWALIGGLFGAALSSATFGLQTAIDNESSVWATLGYFGIAIVASLPDMVRSLLFVAIGWPILLDIAKLLKIDLPDFLYSDRARRLLIGIAVIAALAANVLGAGISAYYNLRGF